MGSERLNSAIRVITGLIGLALVGYFMLFFTREATKMSGWHDSGGLWSETRFADSLVVFTRIAPSDFVSTPLPQIGDTVVAVNDTAINAARWNQYFDSLQAPGQQIPITFRRAGEESRTMILTRTPNPNIFSLMVVTQVLRFLISGLSIGVGLWAFFARPNSAAVRALAFFSFALGAFMISGVSAISGRFAAFTIPYMQTIHNLLSFLGVMVGAFWLNLQLLFPHPVRFMREHPFWAYLLCYGIMVILLIAAVVGLIIKSQFTIGLYALLGVALAQIVAGLIVLTVRYRRAKDRLERRQARLVLLGSGTGLACLLLLIVIANIFEDNLPGGLIGGLLMINVSFMVLLLSPISFAYAFGRYRLLEVEGKLRRGTRYALTIIGLLAVAAAIVYFAGSFLKRTMEGGNVLALALILIIAASIVPLARITQQRLEKWFYPERLRLRRMIHDFLQHALSISDRETFWSELQIRLCDGLRIEDVHPILLVSGNGHYTCMIAGETPFTSQSEFVERLARERRPVLVDELIASSRVYLTAEEIEWLETQRVGLVLPLIAHSSLIGFLGLGHKTEQEDYAAEELRILGSLSSQIAMVSENIRLLDENIVKRQLEEQLQIARRIQQGFLPQEIPVTVGLEIAAANRFCLEVAGDYYDVIPLEDGRTVLAVGDVSGKGAGAALLMANLQASLRTAVGMGSSLEDVVARINDLIHRNTPPEQYITFFVGVYDPQARALTYVNAGHNPPMLVSRNGDMQFLYTGGVILGFMPGMNYEHETVPLAPDDLIVMYTDGVSEAMNGDEEEFGEKRICDSVCSALHQPVQRILSSLEEEVLTYRGPYPLEDDFTLLLVRAP